MRFSRRSRVPRRAGRRAARAWTGTFPRAVSILAATLAVLAAAPAAAQMKDDWLVPGVLLAAAPPASPISMALYEGRDFVAEREERLSPARVARFLHVHGGGREDLLSPLDGGQDLPTSFEASQPGGHLLVLDDDAGVVELGAGDLDASLRREGLGAVAAERARLGEADRPARVRRLALLKALVQIGRARDSVFRRELGQALELRPLVDPTLVLGGALSVALTFRDAPLAGARMELLSRLGARIARASATTDEGGVAALQVPAEGVHLIRAVHAVRCEGCRDAEWQSFVATYTFANGPAMLSGTVTAPPMLGPNAAETAGQGLSQTAGQALSGDAGQGPSQTAGQALSGTGAPIPADKTGAPPTFRSRRLPTMPDVETFAPAPPGMSFAPERAAPTWPLTAAIAASVAAAAAWLAMGWK